jgi:DNA-binding SARP family transcriptional activator
MEALAEQGNVAEALRAYERLRQRLHAELGIAPQRRDAHAAQPAARGGLGRQQAPAVTPHQERRFSDHELGKVPAT